MKQQLVAMVEAALKTAEKLSPANRADVLDGIAIALDRVAPEIADAARKSAAALREAGAAQLLLKKIVEDTK